MVIADEDLRNRAASGDLHHLAAQAGVEVDTDLLDIGHAARLEQLLGAHAERAHGAGVHFHACAHFLPLALRPVASGWPPFSHSAMPPLRLNTFSKPAWRSLVSTLRDRLPVAQHTISGASLNLFSSAMRRSNSDSGKWCALGMWPCAYSPCSRTSMTTASSRLIFCVTSSGASELRSVA